MRTLLAIKTPASDILHWQIVKNMVSSEGTDHGIINRAQDDHWQNKEWAWISRSLHNSTVFESGIIGACSSLCLLHRETPLIAVVQQPMVPLLLTLFLVPS